MTTRSDDPMADVRRELAAWHATHPRATFADMETAVEARVHRLRAILLEERAAAAWHEEHPACPQCGTRMVPRSRSEKTVVMPGEEAIGLRRTYVVCPVCGTGLFPPG